MHRILSVGFAMTLLAAGLLLASNAAVGTWEVISAVDGGDESTWKLVITEDGDQLAGTISGESGDFSLHEVKLNGDELTFKVTIDDQTYVSAVKISGSKFEGAFKGGPTKGTLKGTKQS